LIKDPSNLKPLTSNPQTVRPMNALHYLLQVNAYLVLFYGFYWLVLRGETFHQLNRWYLVAAAALSFFIPVWESDWVQRWFVTEQVHETLYTYYNPETVFVTTLRPEEPGFRLTWGDAFAFGYLTGVLVALGKFGYQMAHLERFLRRRKRSNSRQAFSFFGHLFVGKSLDKRDTILAHERVHVRQLHSADVLLFELILIFNWFNPVVYLYRRSVRYLHEFIADEVASRCEASPADYALLLFSQQFGVETHQLVNPFFSTSLLKRRILMLQKPRSRRTALLKYGFIAPLFGGMLVMSSASVAENPVLQTIETRVGSAQAIVEKPVQDDEAIVTGTVTDEAGQPLAGVQIKQQPNLGVIHSTDSDGTFSFIRGEQKTAVQFSYPGYETVRVSLDAKKPFAVRLRKKSSITEEEVRQFIQLAATRVANSKRESLIGQTQLNSLILVGFSINAEGTIEDIRHLNSEEGDRFGLFDSFQKELKQMPRWAEGSGGSYYFGRQFLSAESPDDYKRNEQTSAQAEARVKGGRKGLGMGIFGMGGLNPMPHSSGPYLYGIATARVSSAPVPYEEARFPYGHGAFRKFIQENLRYPREAADITKSEVVFVDFIVDEAGNLSQFKLKKNYGHGFDEEARRMFRLLPRFEPYKKEGKPVVSRYTMRLDFAPPVITGAPAVPAPVPAPVAAPVDTLPKDPDRVFTVAEKNAGFPGGYKALSKYLAKNLQYPATARRATVEGKVFLTFIVEKDGSISDVNVLKGRGFGLDEEAIRVLKAMPKWVPGEAKGKIVRSRFNLPIEFRLDGTVKRAKEAPVSSARVAMLDLVAPKILKGTSFRKDQMPLVIVDDKIVDENILRGINRLDVKDFKYLGPKEAIEKYGEKARYGAYIATGL
jgi:TonB family protein